MDPARLSIAPLTICTALVALALEGCGSNPKPEDLDGDGYTPWDGDCWEDPEGPPGSGLTGADIHPGADDQMGDGIDQNCDGGLEYDFDGDGYDRVADGGEDCDDDNAEIHPGATEICDGVDDDCDGLVDDDDTDLELGDWYLDGDSDGYGGASAVVASCSPPDGYTDVGGDCDDANPATYPDAPELCDGADNDCDDSIDEDPDDPTNSNTWWADADDDGYGDPDTTEVTCEDVSPTGYSDNSRDCDDTRPDVNPDATEVCDGIDNNCNSLADDDDPDSLDPDSDISGVEIWYADFDDDTYGDLRSTISACTMPTGYVADSSDCNDLDSAINPGATEICNGDVDDDCDGLADDDDTVDPGTATIWYLDSDGDGYGDASVSLTQCSTPLYYVAYHDGDAIDCDDEDASAFPDATEVCYSGIRENCDKSIDDVRATCASGDMSASNADSTRLGTHDSEGAGSSLARWSSTSGTEGGIVLGASYYVAGDGAIYLVDGPFSRSADPLADTVYTARRRGSTGSALGTAVAAGADIDGDGYADLFAGAPDYNNGSKTNAGAAFLEYGPITGAANIPGTSDTILTISKKDQHVGMAVAAGTFVSDDTFADLAAGSPDYDYDYGSGPISSAGAVYVVEGPPTSGTLNMTSSYTWRITGDGTGDLVGAALATIGDVNGDGNADLLIGVPGDSDTASGAGSAALILGPIDSSGTLADLADLTFRGTSASSAAGSAVASAGDTNGDGYDDLIIGGPGTSSGAGQAWLVLGDETSSLDLSVLATSADAILSGASGDEAGTSVSGNFDINGDGNSEILIGGPGADSDTGVAWMLYGPVTGTLTLSTDADVTISGESAGDALGTAVSGLGDTDGDGLDDLVVGAPGVDSSSLTDAGAVYLFALWY